ncbi:MerR family transcriptional regulator [Naumannella cuiyingiana]|uniref:DNA-binding transcriptional MerR regulator n=1 Tax=Naumannella cuiyingiana TaxID=1347891 RepID=A0A7Z0IKB3_9ACTN|nr:MerR family transcriptional regulator [Naumannella cuiyingiana]NYI70282.1 DNA-binding transcriptional MerR regulator [Naumannella cuiyingiana]
MNDATRAIGEVAEQLGLSADALRFYEREGLLIGPVVRDAAGRRRYAERDVSWLGVCTRLRDTGMPIEKIRRYAALVRDGGDNHAERLALLREHEAAVSHDIDELIAARAVIRSKIDSYAEQLAHGAADRLWDNPR